MARTINDVYDEYQIMPNLRTHQLRVTAVGLTIAENFKFDLEIDNLVSALLLHDMGNIIKFKLDKFPEFLQPQGLKYWQKIQNQYKDTYGDDEHVATEEILKELGVSERIRTIATQVGFSKACFHLEHTDWERKIAEYADMRVTPFKVVSLAERTEDGRKRYGFERNSHNIQMNTCLQQLERDIFSHCKITPEFITNTVVEPYFSRFLKKEL